MRVGVPRETAAGERRVALVPEGAARLVRSGLEVIVEGGAGAPAQAPDSAYVAAGATLVETPEALHAAADIIVRVARPSIDEAERLRANMVLIGLLQPTASAVMAFAEGGVAEGSVQLPLVPPELLRCSRPPAVTA